MALSQAILDVGYIIMALSVLVSAESLVSGAGDLSRGQVSESSSQRLENSLIVMSGEGDFTAQMNLSGYEVYRTDGDVYLRTEGSDGRGSRVETFTSSVSLDPDSSFDAGNLWVDEASNLRLVDGRP